MTLKHDLNAIIPKAIMRKQAVVIVEGKDDRQIYDRIAKSIQKDLKMYAVEEFDNYAAGCDNVIKCLHILQTKFTANPQNLQYILGIIDRDSRPYKVLQVGEIDYTQLQGLHVLKYYSIETYFANRNSLKQLIAKVTYAVEEDITSNILAFVEQNLNSTNEENLYYLSLEALKSSCDSTYAAVIGYATNYTNGKDLTELHVVETQSNTYLLGLIMPKKVNLDTFAISQNISQSDLKLIAKGKWYLFHYIYHISSQIQNLHKEHKDNRGKFHTNRFYNDTFLMKIQGNMPSIRQQLYQQILECIDVNECNDIILAFNNLQ